MLGKDKPQGPGWVRAVPALCLSPWEPRGAEAALSAAGRAGQDLEDLVRALRTEPQRLLSRPLAASSSREGSTMRGTGRRDISSQLGGSVASLETSLVLPAADEEEEQG